MSLTAHELTRGLETLTLPNAAFRHRQHLQATVYYLRLLGYPHAQDRILGVIRAYAQSLAHERKFHVTLTTCWTRLVAAALEAETRATSFEEFLKRNPKLLDKWLPLRFYSRELLFSDDARSGWVEADLTPLPICPPHAGVNPWD